MGTRPVRLKLLRAVHNIRVKVVEGVLTYRLDRVSWCTVLIGCLGVPF